MRTSVRLVCLFTLVGCAAPTDKEGDPGVVDVGSAETTIDAVVDAPVGDGLVLDSGVEDVVKDVGLDPDAACATTTVEAKAEVLPVDIVWMVDNSASMEPAVAEVKKGLNAFAAKIDGKKLDYKVIMLALRNKTSPVDVAGKTRYPVCIPPPLAGDGNCGNGPRFFHSSVDMKSTQPLEQFLGSLDQTAGYTLGEERGGEPWKSQLRPTASKTIVVVTDDNARLSATDFETFPGGKNPFNSLTLGAGILHASRAGLFKDYIFHGVYGWGSETSPSAICKYADGSSPPASGETYTTLVKKTGGTRAKICNDAATEWPKFLDAVASAVVKTTKLACTLALPTPATGTLDPGAVNVQIEGASGKTLVPKVKDAAACGSGLGWYYDNDTSPKQVLLCPGACDAANAAVGVDKPGKISILFGCKTVIK